MMGSTLDAKPRKHIIVFTGGSAANSLVDVFEKVAEDKGCSLSYIIPISDNGGSSSELIRVFGGPGIGDVRSRLIRLIPSTPSTLALKTLLSHRLPSSPHEASLEWSTIIHGSSPLILALPPPQRELIRSYLSFLSLEILKRSRPPHSTFNLSSAAIGNLFLTGARLFTGSFEAAIYLLSVIGGIAAREPIVNVIPSINSNFSHHICAGLRDGSTIIGQNAISHPTEPEAVAGAPLPSILISRASSGTNTPSQEQDCEPPEEEEEEEIEIEDANLPGTHPTLRLPAISFRKDHTASLPSRIAKIWYINPYGQPMLPSPSSRALSVLEEASCVVFSIGSLYTSLAPSLILRGVGERLSRKNIRSKILILNGCLDRETEGYTAEDFIRAIVDACKSSYLKSPEGIWNPPSEPATPVAASHDTQEEEEEEDGEKDDWNKYITHLIYLAGEGTPKVDKDKLTRKGIECVRIYGRRNPEPGGEGMWYDGKALGGALEAIIGREKGAEGKRRYTNER